MTKDASEARKQQIIGWLSAYRNGWVSFDVNHVRELKQELQQLNGKPA